MDRIFFTEIETQKERNKERKKGEIEAVKRFQMREKERVSASGFQF